MAILVRVTQQPEELTVAAVVLASGAGTRLGSELNKAYLPLAGIPVVAWSLRALGELPAVGVLVLVARPEDERLVTDALSLVSGTPPVEVVAGGTDRQESELLALRHLADRINTGAVDTVLLHDAARPLVSAELAGAVLRAAREHGGAIPGVECADLAVATEDGTGLQEPLPGTAIRAQTPQGFHARSLVEAYEDAARAGFVGTDTASCVQRFTDVAVHWVQGEQRNIKMTYAVDLAIAERLVAELNPRSARA